MEDKEEAINPIVFKVIFGFIPLLLISVIIFYGFKRSFNWGFLLLVIFIISIIAFRIVAVIKIR